MSKKVLCVGINDYPGEGYDLNGCVNDAWAALRYPGHGFPGSDQDWGSDCYGSLTRAERK